MLAPEVLQPVTVLVYERRKLRIHRTTSIVGLLGHLVGLKEPKENGGSVMRLTWG